jgi:hypothetical protein
LVGVCRAVRDQREGEKMTVAELREKLSKQPADAKVVVYWEDGAEHQCFGIDEVSMTKGNPRRTESGKAGFTFDSKGVANWLFISISPE